jgi:Fic family protein
MRCDEDPMGSEIDISGTPYCYDASQRPRLEAIGGRVAEMRKSGRLGNDALKRIRKFFRIKNIYHSNAIEGNILNVGETRQVVEQGLTLTGKPLKDQAEAKNLSEALDFLENLAVDRSVPITEADIRQLHLLVLKNINDDNAGSYRAVDVEIGGSGFKPPGPESVPAEMQEFSEWLTQVTSLEYEFGSVDALLVAAAAHTWFVSIHPFIDGNGRVSRLVLNLVLMRAGYPIAIVTKEDRLRYYDALEESQSSDLSAFIALVLECVEESLEEYEHAAAEQRELDEWARSLASKFTEREEIRAHNEFELWRNAMDLLRSYFRQAAEVLDETAATGKVFFKDFGSLEFEKYLSLREGRAAKKTWFFRVDFRSGDRAARYLFFFGFPSYVLKPETDVTLHVARENPPGSFHYDRLEDSTEPNVPDLFEIGYKPDKEVFVKRGHSGRSKQSKIDVLVREFFDEVVSKHFQSD